MKRNLLLVVIVAVALVFGAVSNASIIEDFEDVSDWGAGGERGAFSSVAIDSAQAQVGNSAGAFNYSVSEAVGNDYVDFYNDRVNVDLSDTDSIAFKMLLPNDSDMVAQLKLYSATGGFIEYTFGAGNGVWTDYTLSISSDFADYGTNPDLSHVNLIKLVVIGDVSSNASNGTIYMDQMQAVPEPATLLTLGFGIAGMFLRRK